ncbi:hypothetical protein AtubIFM57258_000984 [Aspergillus tubingensis]|nr:hypothetical protein AtubIFM57258_000984 [Aspergillus tubingensis]
MRGNELPKSEVPSPKVLWLNPARRRVYHTFNLKCQSGIRSQPLLVWQENTLEPGQQNAKSLLRGLALYMLDVAKFTGVLPNGDLQAVKQEAMPFPTVAIQQHG